jgi:hypothetical protein
MAQMMEAMGELREAVERGASGTARRYDAELEAGSPTNFWRPLTGGVRDGGLFVATYEKPPPLGSKVLITLGFPSGRRCELPGIVQWVQDALGEDAPPGFGLRFDGAPAEAQALIESYATARDPLLRDD